MESKIYVNPRTKQKKLNITSFKDEWVYSAHENNDNQDHLIEYIRSDKINQFNKEKHIDIEKYNQAIAALKSVSQSQSSNAEVLKEFCSEILKKLN